MLCVSLSRERERLYMPTQAALALGNRAEGDVTVAMPRDSLGCHEQE